MVTWQEAQLPVMDKCFSGGQHITSTCTRSLQESVRRRSTSTRPPMSQSTMPRSAGITIWTLPATVGSSAARSKVLSPDRSPKRSKSYQICLSSLILTRVILLPRSRLRKRKMSQKTRKKRKKRKRKILQRCHERTFSRCLPSKTSKSWTILSLL